MAIYLSLLIAVIGAIVYLLSDKPKPAELGKWSFIIGLFAFLMVDAARVFSVISK